MDFKNASQKITELSQRPDNSMLLKLYALYKQGSTGDVSGKRPGLIDFKGRAKWDAWKKLEGMSSPEAQQAYIKLVEDLIAKDS